MDNQEPLSPAEAEELVKEGFVPISAACKLLGLSRAALYRLLNTGELPSARFGGARRIPRLALTRYAVQALLAPPARKE